MRHYDDDYDADFGGARWHAGSAGHPRQRWWGTGHPPGRPWASGQEWDYEGDYQQPRGLRAGGRQGPGRAWGMGGNVEFESEQRRYHGMRGGNDWRGYDADYGGADAWFGARGRPVSGQARTGRYYGHRSRSGEPLLHSEAHRVPRGYDDGYARGGPTGHVSYGEEYTEAGRGPRGARRTGHYAAEYGSGEYRGRSPRRGGGCSPRRASRDETRGGMGWGSGYTR